MKPIPKTITFTHIDLNRAIESSDRYGHSDRTCISAQAVTREIGPVTGCGYFSASLQDGRELRLTGHCARLVGLFDEGIKRGDNQSLADLRSQLPIEIPVREAK